MSLVHWVINPPSGVRFVSQFNGSIDIEFEPGRENEVAAYLHERLDAMREVAAAHTLHAPAQQVAPAPAAPSPGAFDPNCAPCAWANEKVPNSRCAAHSVPQAPPTFFPLPTVPTPPLPVWARRCDSCGHAHNLHAAGGEGACTMRWADHANGGVIETCTCPRFEGESVREAIQRAANE